KQLIRVAIDGPAAAGKSTVAKIVAERLGYVYVDTGAMYRAITLKVCEQGISLDDEDAINELVKHTSVTLKNENGIQLVLLDGKDVSDAIRNQQVSQAVSKVATYRAVREALTEKQIAMAEHTSVVMDGRDIGTAVIPQAEVKIFLIASAEERAQRRHEENIKRGYPSTFDSIVEEIKARDKQDYEREISPLTKAKDAYELDTTSLSIEEVARKIIKQ